MYIVSKKGVDIKMIIYTANSRRAKTWHEKDVTWDELCKKLSRTITTSETVTAYRQMSKDEQSDIKDVGGFVGGALRDGRRKKGNVLNRSLLTLDIDFGTPDTLDDIIECFPYAFCVYSTHKHTPESPRLRLVIPLDRLILDVDEYQALGRKVAEHIGIELFDSTTYDASRLMYWPSTSSDGVYVYYKSESDRFLPVNDWLNKYSDWKNIAEWPVSVKESKVRTRSLTKQQDPTTKEGVIGTFCRMYPISDCIETYLSDFYEPCGENRYTFKGGTTHGGAVCYDDKFLYSYHDTDPASETLCNSFDLLRIHLFGELDNNCSETNTSKLPSFSACQEFLLRDDNIKQQTILSDAGFEATDDTEPITTKPSKADYAWVKDLSVTSKGEVKPSLENCELILAKDVRINHVKYNELEGLCEAEKLPWARLNKFWSDSDDAALLSYINTTYHVFFSDRVYRTAFSTAVMSRKYHPIKIYLENLPEWDKTPRVDELLINYLGADDNDYVRAVTRKLLVAAIKRIYRPGCKFDNILVLQGPEGIGKSTLIAKLGGDWFSDSISMSDARDVKTAAERLKGSWIIEFAELKGLRDSSSDYIKAFLSRQDDRYRASYARNVESHPRQCVFFGTTNDDGYLNDPTSARRFWPVPVEGEKIANSWDITEEERAQIWAEALVYYKAKEPLTLTPELNELANEYRDGAVDLDSRAQMVTEFLDIPLPEESEWNKFTDYQKAEYIRNFKDPDNSIVANTKATRLRNEVTIAEVWVECFGKPLSDIKRSDETKLGLLMKTRRGWDRVRRRDGIQRAYVYVRKGTEEW